MRPARRSLSFTGDFVKEPRTRDLIAPILDRNRLAAPLDGEAVGGLCISLVN